MLGDLRYAFRLMARNPGFTTLAVLMLGLGIGANTAIFSVVDAALFKPLPYRDPERLVDILRVSRPGTAEQVSSAGMMRESLADWRAQRQIFEGIESYGPIPIVHKPTRFIFVSSPICDIGVDMR